MSIAAILMLVGQLIGLYYYEVDTIQGVMRVYVVLMCVVIVLNELEWTDFIRESSILRIWVPRGMFYSFVGVLGIEEDDTEYTRQYSVGEEQALQFIIIVAYIMVACGVAYFVMGCLCLQLLRNRVVSDYDEKCKEAMASQKKVGGSLV